MKKLHLFFIMFLINIQVFAQEEVLQEAVFKDNIYTLMLHPENAPLSYPIINLNGNEKLKLSFDDLEKDKKIKDYQYTIIHCNADWTMSDLFYNDYIDGFEENDIIEYDQSFNTFCDYIHYKTIFPNDDLEFLVSGNYIVKVYEDYDIDDVVLQARFVVVEQQIAITSIMKTATRADLKFTSQEIDFSLFTQNSNISNPLRDINVTITQNNRWDNAIYNLRPRFIKNNELSFDYDFENVFLGGNEFRYFDAKDMKFAAERTQNIEYKAPFYHFYLINDEILNYRKYTYNADLNGKIFIKNDRGFNSENESDYLWVHFTLKSEFEYPNDVYIFGGLTNWACTEKAKMFFNEDKQQYECELFVKQGYYNYQFAILNSNSGEITTTELEGSHFDTENDYIIYVYLRDQSLNYDKLIGVKTMNSYQ